MTHVQQLLYYLGFCDEGSPGVRFVVRCANNALVPEFPAYLYSQAKVSKETLKLPSGPLEK